MKTVSNHGWTVETIINSKNIKLQDNEDYSVRSLIQNITAPDGSKIKLSQLLDNFGDYESISIDKLK